LIISTDTEKAIDKMHPFMIKVLMKLRKEGIYNNVIKGIYDKPIANIIPNREKLKAFPLKSGTKQGCLLFPFEFNIVLKSLARTTRKEEKMK
jgi:hypothetical protein